MCAHTAVTLGLEQHGRQKRFKIHLLTENCGILIKISLKFLPETSIDKTLALV